MSAWHLAQINVGRLLAPIDAPETAEFVANLDRVNAIADASPGFVWRLVGEGGNATDIHAFDDPMMAINMSTCGCALLQKLHSKLAPSIGDFRSLLSGITTSVRAARSNRVRRSSPRRTPYRAWGQRTEQHTTSG